MPLLLLAAPTQILSQNPKFKFQTCIEPENPYDEGGGHYAGYEWAIENNSSCEGNAMRSESQILCYGFILNSDRTAVQNQSGFFI